MSLRIVITCDVCVTKLDVPKPRSGYVEDARAYARDLGWDAHVAYGDGSEVAICPDCVPVVVESRTKGSA